MQACPVISLGKMIEHLFAKPIQDTTLSPASKWIRSLHYQHKDGSALYGLVNEGSETYHGSIQLSSVGTCYAYNAWDNRLESVNARQAENRFGTKCTAVEVEIEPLKSLLIVFDPSMTSLVDTPAVKCAGERIPMKDGWMRSICPGIAYPNFQQPRAIHFPDRLAQEQPNFSGFVRYENRFQVNTPAKAVLEITDAHEGVEVFVNSHSCGIQIAPPFRFDISRFLKQGENHLQIEVATTLERQVGRKGLVAMMVFPKPSALSGITGDVNLYIQ
jgi:hypothetical protein